MFFSSPFRVAVSVAAPLAPLLLHLGGFVGWDAVQPLFLLVYQFLAMALYPWFTAALTGGWKLFWLIRPADSIDRLFISYVAFFAATAAPPPIIFQALLYLIAPEYFLPQAVPVTLFGLGIGMLNQSLSLLLLSLLPSMAYGWAAVLLYQALLYALAIPILIHGWSESYLFLAPFFPLLVAVAPSSLYVWLYVAAVLCLASSILFTYILANRLVRPAAMLR